MTKGQFSDSRAARQRSVVLHIDDDANDVALMQAAVRRARVPVEWEIASDMEEAMRYLGEGSRNRVPTLVVVDLKLPRRTGFEIVEWIRSNPDTRHIPVVVLSGSERRADIQRAYDAGANSYVVKPLGFEPLVRLVSQMSVLWCGVAHAGC